jgi:hypothetical protein
MASLGSSPIVRFRQEYQNRPEGQVISWFDPAETCKDLR